MRLVKADSDLVVNELVASNLKLLPQAIAEIASAVRLFVRDQAFRATFNVDSTLCLWHVDEASVFIRVGEQLHVLELIFNCP